MATWEGEMGRFQFQASLGKKVLKISSEWKKAEHGDMHLSSQQWWEL
jgi:hypothetical protein